MNANSPRHEIDELHLQLGLLQTLDVGLIVLNKDYQIHLWNSFMENHSGLLHSKLFKRNIFEAFPELPSQWLRHKIDSVFLLKNRSFITWEQRPYLFKFKPHRPITGEAPFMYQNATLIPLKSPDGQVENVGIIIYDVTDAAIGKIGLEEANTQLQHLSQTDQLTSLYNRGFWEARLRHEFDRFSRTQAPSSLLMMDIDHFKKINDNFGHPAGDEVLRQMAAILKDVTRTTDIVGRYGGEEFGILLIDSNAKQSLRVTERLRDRISRLVVKHLNDEIRFTISMGLTEISNSFQTHEQWIQLADQALYQSKSNGRDRLTILGTED